MDNVIQEERETLVPESASSFCKKSYSKYLRPCGPNSPNYSTLP